MINKFCIDCKKQLSQNRAKRCRKCYHKKRNKINIKNIKDLGKISYWGLHKWLKKYLSKPKLCEFCNKVSPKHVANLSQKYKLELNDYKWLCASCHTKYDWKCFKNKS